MPPSWAHLTAEYPLPAWPDDFRLVDAPVRNWSERRPPGVAVDCIVIHDTETLSVKSVLATFDNPAEQRSAHYLIDRDGTTYRMVDEAKKAWHAGVSKLGDRDDVNEFSIGIELMDVDQGPAAVTYTDAQLTTLVALTVDLMLRHLVPLERVVGHAQIAMPPGRKTDPGRDFPWTDFLVAIDYHASRRRA